jgi:signal transduction histidine kinase
MNMITNALEATPPGQTAVIRAAAGRKAVTFSVWNGQAMAPGVARRVFQRYFTTKSGPGRGLGTFAMKWLTERYLKGTVSFTSTQAGGTTFRLRLPERA